MNTDSPESESSNLTDPIRKRRDIIKKILESKKIKSIGRLEIALRDEFNKNGDFELPSRAKINRDLKALNYEKENGIYIYKEPPAVDEEKSRRLKAHIKRHVRNIAAPLFLVGLKTTLGDARSVEYRLQKLFGKRIFGTISGENCVFIAFEKTEQRNAVYREIAEITGFELE